MGEEVVGKALICLNHRGSHFVWISHMARGRYKGTFSSYPLSYFLVYFFRTGDRLESLSGVLNDYQNTHGYFNKCD